MTALDLTLLRCPQWADADGSTRCGAAFIILDAYSPDSSEGYVPSVALRCDDGHVLNGPVDSMWPREVVTTLAIRTLSAESLTELIMLADLVPLIRSGSVAPAKLADQLASFTVMHPQASNQTWRKYVEQLADTRAAA